MQPFLGQVALFSFDTAPQAWARCDGQLVPIATNTALYSLIGTTYGGDGKENFALPKLPPVQPAGPHYYIALQGVFPQ